MSESDLAISVKGVSKLFRLGLKEQQQDTFARSAINFLKSPFSNFKRYQSLYRFDDVDFTGAHETPADVLWALRNVSFDVPQGQVLGIIGMNGAGKSTLLKVLSLITPPSTGELMLRGRISSLLEVGTGFHPDLTGSENIYLNGTILGMRKKEVDAKFDEIVEFSGVEKFLETPVKRYSSGMRVRLAFAVAAHLEPEILIVDEVLAVGDASFQKKCLSKMEDVGKTGRTVLFVSHSMQAITRLCDRVIMLKSGQIIEDGSPAEVVTSYLHSDQGTSAARIWSETDAPGAEVARLLAVRVVTEDGAVQDSCDIRRPIGLEMEYEVLQDGHKLLPHFHVHNEEGIQVFTTHDHSELSGKPRARGRYRSTAWIPGNFMSEGTMFVSPALVTVEPKYLQFYERETVAFTVIDTMEGDSARGDWAGNMDGIVRPLLQWTVERDGD